MSGGRTDGRTDFFESYPRFIQKNKTRIWSNKVFQPFLSHIRVLSKWIKRGCGPKNIFQPFLSHISVLSERIKRGYGPENGFSAFFESYPRVYKGISICIKNIEYCPIIRTNKNKYSTSS
jgi:hypothetical protein